MNNKSVIKKTPAIKKLPPLSIIIPTFNEQHTIKKCIQSIISQNYPNLKIIIVNDGSTDNTGNIVKQFVNKNIRYIATENKGKASALNTGLKYVKTKFVGFIDSDTYLSENALKNMVGHLNQKTAGVIATIRPHSANSIMETIQKIEYMVTAFTRKLMAFVDALYFTPAFAIYKTDVIKKIGGFDEGNITEDLEIGLRMNKKGYRIESSMRDFAFTDIPGSFKQFFKQRIRWYRGYIYNSIKYSDMFFNSKFKSLGMFILPVQYITLALTSTLIIYGIFDISFHLINYFSYIFAVNFDFLYSLNQLSFNISLNTILWVMLLSSFLVMLKLSEKTSEEKIGYFDYAVYLITYPFINIFLWVSAFVLELLQVKKKW
jgi:cellulose synthase/poly-beta-1,6-N-acetylglucosamine synthase-like glycosyltransferase